MKRDEKGHWLCEYKRNEKERWHTKEGVKEIYEHTER